MSRQRVIGQKLREELQAAWQNGQALAVEELLGRHRNPQLDRQSILDLVYLEYCLRKIAGEQVSKKVFLKRFPDLADNLERRWEKYEAVVAATVRSPLVRNKPRPGLLLLRCPHCREPFQPRDEDPMASVQCPSCGSDFNLASDTDTVVQAGSDSSKNMLGHFQLLRHLGQGAFGSVWKARDTKLDRIVAIKTPRKEELTEVEAEKFFREARAAAQLHHPNIVAVYESQQLEDGRIYISCDYIEGASLDQWVEVHPPTVRQAVEICVKIANGLHHAHDRGVVHRDLKPQNILMDASGEPYVADFGMAKRDAGEATMTVDGAMMGTPAYMSPEQARGEAHSADRRSDVYSLGVILFQLLTGELPFRGRSQMLLMQILNEEPPAPRKLDSKLPRDVETICLKCLEKDPARRYQTSAALSADLKGWRDGYPIQARRVTSAGRAWRWCRRNAMVATLSALFILTLITGATVAMYFAIEADKEAESSRASARAAADSDASARASLKIAEENIYNSDMLLAERDWENENIGHLRELLDKHRDSDDLKGFEWYYWDRLAHFEIFTLTEHEDMVRCVAYSPDGQRLASSSDDGAVKVWDADTGAEVLTLTGHTGDLPGILDVRSVAFSPDGNWLATGGWDCTVRLWDVSAGSRKSVRSEVSTLKGHDKFVTCVAFSPDGRRLASASEDETVRLWDVESGRQVSAGRQPLTLKGDGAVTSLAFSPNGQWLAVAHKQVKVWDTDTGAEVVTRTGNRRWVLGMAFSPDGQRLALASDDGIVNLWSPTTNRDILALKGHQGAVKSVSFSPDGLHLASGSVDRTVRLWDIAGATEVRTLKGHTDEVWSVVYSPDGEKLASASLDGTVKMWNAALDDEVPALKGHRGKVTSVAFSPDGQLASASEDGTVKLWDVATGEELDTLKANGYEEFFLTSVAFSADGNLVAGSSDKTVKGWDVRGRELPTLKGHTDDVKSVAFSPDGQRLASAGEDNTVRLWDAKGKEILRLDGHTDFVTSVAFHPDGQSLASASHDATVKIWDTYTGEERRTIHGHATSVTAVVFSPDGERLVSTSHDRTVKVWEPATGKEVFTLRGHGNTVTSAAFSRNGRRLASASDDNTVKLWDVHSGHELLTLAHADKVGSVAFSPDGRRLVTGAGQLVHVWDAWPSTQ